MYRIFVVEDDEVIARTVKKHLEGWDYEVKCAEDFSNVMSEFTVFSPQLVLMDIKLPFYNGYHWCSEIRKVSKVPVIFVSSASENMNIVMAVNMGGDDFIAKPFDLDVLTVKVQAMLRRSYDFTGQSAVLEHKGAMLNQTEATLVYKEEKLELTKNELRILQTLMENKDKVVSRDTLMTKLWESDSYVDEVEYLNLLLQKKELGIDWDEIVYFLFKGKCNMDFYDFAIWDNYEYTYDIQWNCR